MLQRLFRTRSQFWSTVAIVLVGLPVLTVLILSSGLMGHSQTEVPTRAIQWPAGLSALPAQAADLAADGNGILWFPVLEPPDGQGEQTNSLYRYDPAKDSLQSFALPADEGSTFSARVEAGAGARRGRIIVAWESTLLEVDSASGEVKRLDLPLDAAKIVTGGEPPSVLIYDIAMDSDGTIWVSRDHYAYLMAVYADGSSKEFALPEEAGSPQRLAIDGQGRIWATLIRHQPVSNGAGLPATNAYRYTARFDPTTSAFDVLPIRAWNIAGRGGNVVAMAGDAPAPVQRVDTSDSVPVAITRFGPTLPGDEMAVSPNGDTWYRSRSVPGLVHVGSGGRVVAFPLPVSTGSLNDTLGGSRRLCAANDPSCDPSSQVVTAQTPVLAIAAAPDGSAWFSTGDRIGHAVP